jgi:SecD/SecF fusion protein
VSKDEKVKLMNLVQMSAKLQFRLVNKDNDRLVSQYQADPEKFVPEVGYEMLESLETHSGKKKPEKRVYFVQVKPEMDGRDISDAYLTTDQFGQRQISLEFNASGAKIFGDVTRANVGRQMAIVLDGKLYSAPVIRDAIEGGHAVITGQFSKEEGENISNALVSGSLPVKIKLDAVFDTDPSLGAESLRQSMWAGIISLVLIIGFMIVYYMKSGIVASIALVFNMIMLLGAMAAFECTLTLPGIAGIILTLGMAVDGNIIIYERIREELLKGKSVLSAIEIGFSRSFLTVVDANITTLIVGVILMWVGTGPVKGFGVTLSIGIITTLFCSLFISRLCFDTMGWIKPIKSLRMHQFFKKPNLDVLSIQKYNIGVSIFLVILSFAVVGVRGKGVLGVDFTGGSLITMNYEKRVPEADVQKTVAAAGYNNAKITYKASGTGTVRKLEIVLPEKDISKEQLDKKNLSPKEVIMEALNSHYQDAKFSGGQETHIGGLIGWEFTKLAMLAIFLSFFLIIIYVSLRFELAYGVASVIALLHDTTITMGVFFLFGKELSMPVIAAILTVIGYSINDTIIIFDRIRENTKLLKGKSYYEIINTSINETLSRTVLTSTLTALVVLVLFMIGEVSINDFSLVLLFGIVIGTYSSIYIASPVVNIWHKKVNKIPDAA